MNTADITLQTLVNALGDPREGLRQLAIRRLAIAGAPAVPMLVKVLTDKRDYVQDNAAVVLATIGQAAIPCLIEAMKSNDRSLRWCAAWVLSSMPPEARNSIPKVSIPAVSAKVSKAAMPSASESGLHGVWSDAWLTKVRQSLEANKMADVIKLASIANPPATPV